MSSKNKSISAAEITYCISADTTMTSYAVRFVPCSSRLVSLGQFARGTGCLQIHNIDGKSLKTLAEIEPEKPIKCGTFGASSLETRALATGNFVGELAIYDVEVPESPVYYTKAHEQIINAIDGVGGAYSQNGAPEIATASRDGRVCVFDPRVAKPVVTITPSAKADCWSVAFGGNVSSSDRNLVSGYDNGDVSLFDLRAGKQLWKKNVGKGVCCIAFDTKTEPVSNIYATTLEAKINVLTAEHNDVERFEQAAHDSTVWFAAPLPQNGTVFATGGGNGKMCLWSCSNGAQKLHRLAECQVSSQPLIAMDWSSDKSGLFAAAPLSQTLAIGFVSGTTEQKRVE